MKSKKRIAKIITSIMLAIMVFLNLNLNIDVKKVNAKDTNNNVETNNTTKEKEVSKISEPGKNNIKETNGKKYVDNDILLFFKDKVSKDTVNEVVNYVNGSIIGEVTLLNEYQIKVNKSSLDELNKITKDVMDKYSEYVAYASIDYISESASITPNDPWGKNANWDENNVSGNNWGLKAVDAQGAWQYNNIFDESVNKVNVGIVDGGFDCNVEDFPSDYVKYADSNWDLPCDHGTFVTGIIAAKANNNKGVTGLVWNPGKLYLASASAKDYGYLTSGGLTKGVTDVLANGANVVNCSFGGGDSSESILAAIIMSKMIKAGHDFVIVQASGNSSVDAENSSWFAGIDDDALKVASNLYNVNTNDIKDRIIIVGAAELESDGSYMQAEYSNGGKKVNICAPGSNIYSCQAGNEYANWDGTSFAAPHVAGIVELTWRANPKLTGAEVRNIVCDYENTIADVPDNPASYQTTGDYRMVNAKLSVESALKTRSDLVTIYYNSDSDCNVKYKLSNGTKFNSVLMNDNLDNNGYKKSITLPLDKSSYLLAEFGNNSKWDNNNGNYYKLHKGTYEINNGKITEINDKFDSLKFFNFTNNQGDETSIGGIVKLSAKAKDAVGNVQYAFSIVDSKGNEKTIKDYSSKNTAVWHPQSIGDYKLIAKIKDSRGYEVTKEMNFKVIPSPVVESYKIGPKLYGLVGDNVSVSVNISGGKGTSKCTIIAEGGNYPYGDKQLYFTNNYNNQGGYWKPDMDGTYKILCDVTDESGSTHRYLLCKYTVKNDKSYGLGISTLNTSKTSNIEVGEDILINFKYFSDYSSFDVYAANYVTITAVNEDGTSEEVNSDFYYPDKLNTIKWAPTKSGKWTINVSFSNTHGDKASRSVDINVNEYIKKNTSNTTTIYYKGYDTPYIHYAVNNNTWTKAPGIKMTATNEKPGYTHKYVIDLGTYDYVAVCFNNGNGNWDSNNGKNYVFKKGVYTYSNGNQTKISDNSSNFAISYFKGDHESPRTEDTSIVLRAETVNGAKDINYTFESIDNKGNEEQIYSGSSNKATWTPNEAGNYTLKVTAVDSNGNTDTKLINYTINPKVEITSLTLDKECPLKVGEPVKLHVTAKGGTGDYSYSYYGRVSEGSYYQLIYGQETDTVTWTPGSYEAGSYYIGVSVRDSSGYSTSYEVPVTVGTRSLTPLMIYYIVSTDDNLVANQETNIYVGMYAKGEGKLTYNVYAENSDGTKQVIAKDANTNRFKWTPCKSGNWIVNVTVTDEKGQKDHYQNIFKVVDKIQNYTTIYYNGYEDSYIHYKVGDGSWTSAPGVKMEKTDEISGYTHKIIIPLGEADKLTCCFNNGKGTWDNNDTKNYSLGTGAYLISNKKVEQITIPDELSITSAKMSSDEINLGASVDIQTKVISNKGNCRYTVFAINQDTGNFEEISKEKADANVSWTPKEKGTWKVFVMAQDSITLATSTETLKLVVK